MTKLKNKTVYPANKALQNFFDELSGPQTLLDQDKNVYVSNEVDEQVMVKVGQAERLLAKANLLDDFLIESTVERLDERVEPHAPACKVHNNAQQNFGAKELEDKVNDEFSDAINNGQLRDLDISLKDSLSDKFHVIFCEIASMKIAIPLVELGGIHKISSISKVAKQAKWCRGIFVKESEKYICIDASAWLKPNKKGNESVDDYKFGLQLGKSPFLLCCNNIKDTVEVSKGDVKWRNNLRTQAWLAGLVTNEMCALIDGAHLVQDVLK